MREGLVPERKRQTGKISPPSCRPGGKDNLRRHYRKLIFQKYMQICLLASAFGHGNRSVPHGMPQKTDRREKDGTLTDAETFWDRAAFKYAKRPIKDIRAYKQTMERTCSYLTQRDNVLELGCGTGSTAMLLAGSVNRITASDISSAMIAIARDKAADHNIDNIEFRRATPFDTGFQDRAYDAVLAFNLLHLMEDTKATIARVNSLLNPGGFFISKTPCLARQAWFLRPLVGAMRLFRRAPAVSFLSIPELEGHVKDAGFTILETGNYPASPPSRFIVARKA